MSLSLSQIEKSSFSMPVMCLVVWMYYFQYNTFMEHHLSHHIPLGLPANVLHCLRTTTPKVFMRFVLVCFTAMSHRARAICGSWSVCVTGISFQTRLGSLICRKKQSSLWHPGAVVYRISEMTILQSHWHFSGFLRVLVTILRYLNMSLYTCLLMQAKHCKFNVLPLCSAFVLLGGLSVRQQGPQECFCHICD